MLDRPLKGHPGLDLTETLLRSHDWTGTPLGPRAAWSPALSTIYDMMMSAHVAMCATWGPEQTFFYNAAYAPFLGHRHPDSLGQPIKHVWPELWPEIEPLIVRAMAGERVQFTDRHFVMTRNGVPEDTWWDFSYSALHDGAAVIGFLNVTSDATHRVREEQRRGADEANLRLSLKQLDALLGSSSQVRYTLNADWSVLRELTSDGFLTSAGAEQTEWLEAYIPPEDRDQVRAEIARVVRTGETYDLEHRVYRKDGSIGWAQSRAVALKDAAGQVTGWLGAASDVSGLKQAQATLEDENLGLGQQVAERTAELRLYRDIVQADASPILAFDRDHRLIGFNQAHADEFQRVMNHRQEIGENLPALFPPDQASALRVLMDRALAGERFSVVQAFGDPSGEMPTWEINYTPLRDGDGSVVGAFHHARDISERVRADAKLEGLQAQLRQSQKLEAVGQLTGGVAHDFNNLLTIIRSSVDFLRRPDLPEERRRRYMDAVSNTVDRAAKLTSQLLAFARRQALKPEVFEVGLVLGAVTDMLDPIMGTRIQITLEKPEDPCFVKADISQFETALVNMAINARDAMNGQGSLSLRLAPLDALPPIRGHGGAPGSFVAISLTDTGSGIAPDVLGRIFEPFFTTKEVGKGTGLGLSQVFGFAKQSGGDVNAASMLGTGSTFTLYLPKISAESRLPPPLRAEAEAFPSGSGCNVLVVEDNIEVGRFATQILDDLGYRTTWAVNAEEALEKLGLDGSGFDAVFSDVVMPGMGGIELAKILRRTFPGLPVVLASGYSHVLAQDGAHDFELLHKPYSAEQLGRILSHSIGQRPPAKSA